MFWFNSYLDANIESYKTLKFVGVAPSFAFMLLIWIVFFTMNNEHAESSLAKVLLDSTLSEASGGDEVVSPQGGIEDEF